jgi:hypothetical protein
MKRYPASTTNGAPDAGQGESHRGQANRRPAQCLIGRAAPTGRVSRRLRALRRRNRGHRHVRHRGLIRGRGAFHGHHLGEHVILGQQRWAEQDQDVPGPLARFGESHAREASHSGDNEPVRVGQMGPDTPETGVNHFQWLRCLQVHRLAPLSWIIQAERQGRPPGPPAEPPTQESREGRPRSAATPRTASAVLNPLFSF